MVSSGCSSTWCIPASFFKERKCVFLEMSLLLRLKLAPVVAVDNLLVANMDHHVYSPRTTDIPKFCGDRGEIGIVANNRRTAINTGMLYLSTRQFDYHHMAAQIFKDKVCWVFGRVIMSNNLIGLVGSWKA